MRGDVLNCPPGWAMPAMLAVGSQQGIAAASLARACGVTVVGVSFHVLTYALIGLFAMAFGMAAALCPRRASPSRPDSILRAIADVAASAAAVFSIVWLTLCKPAPITAFALCAVCSAGIAWFDLRWGENFSKLSTEDLFRVIIARIIVASVWLIVSCAIPSAWRACAVCATAMVIGLALLRLGDSIPWGNRELFYPKEVLPGFCGVAMGVFAVGLLFGLRELFGYADDGVLDVLSNMTAVTVGLIAYWWLFKAGKSIDFDLLFRAFLVIFALGVFLAPLGLAWASSMAECLMSLVVLLMANMVALPCAYVARHSSLHPFLVFGTFYALYGLPRLLVAAINASGISEGYFGTSTTGFYHALMLFVIAIATAFSFIKISPDMPPIFGDLFAPRIAVPDDSADAVNDLERAFGSLEEEYALSKREGEVMRLICHGRSKVFIAETLYLSENTVRMHSRNLYSKLGIHSKQELINKVEGYTHLNCTPNPGQAK